MACRATPPSPPLAKGGSDGCAGGGENVIERDPGDQVGRNVGDLKTSGVRQVIERGEVIDRQDMTKSSCEHVVRRATPPAPPCEGGERREGRSATRVHNDNYRRRPVSSLIARRPALLPLRTGSDGCARGGKKVIKRQSR